jgi:hypothetical protein
MRIKREWTSSTKGLGTRSKEAERLKRKRKVMDMRMFKKKRKRGILAKSRKRNTRPIPSKGSKVAKQLNFPLTCQWEHRICHSNTAAARRRATRS